MRKAWRSLAVVGLGLALVGAMVTSSRAVNWGTLTAYESNRSVAQAYGKFTNAGYTYARQASTYRSVGSNDVYVRTEWYYWRTVPNTTYPADWHLAAARSTEVINTTAWTTRTQDESLASNGSRARGNTRVLAARPWYVANPASVYAYPTFNY